MKRLWCVLLIAACHKEIKQDIQLDQQTELSENKSLAATDSSHDKMAELFEQTIEPVIQDLDGKLDIDPVPATATAPAVPGKHFTFHAHQDGGKVVIRDDIKATDNDTKKVKVDDKLKLDTVTKAKIKTDTVTDAGPGWKFYLTLALIAALVIVGIIVVLKYKLWRPL